jgi:hypothetical protein
LLQAPAERDGATNDEALIHLEALHNAYASRDTKTLNFTFYMSNGDHETKYMRTRIRATNARTKNRRNTLGMAFSEAWNAGSDTKSHFAKGGQIFSVTQAKKNPTDDPTIDKSTDLGTVLGEMPAGPMSHDKMRIALSLAEFGLIILMTPWLSVVCRCTLRVLRQQPPSNSNVDAEFLQAEYIFRLVSSQNANNPDTDWTCQCDRPYDDRALPYLGLLWIEMALGEAVTIQQNNRGACRIANMDLTIQDIDRRMLETSGSKSYCDAVRHCLTSDLRLNNVGAEELDTYIEKVYAP